MSAAQETGRQRNQSLAEILTRLPEKPPQGIPGYFRFHMQGEVGPLLPRESVLQRSGDTLISPRLHRFNGTKEGDIIHSLFTFSRILSPNGEEVYYAELANPPRQFMEDFATQLPNPRERFLLTDLSPSDKEALASLGMAQVDMSVSVTKGSANEEGICGQDSHITIRRINGVQEIFDGTRPLAEGLPHGNPLLIQGEFMRGEEIDRFQLRLADGQTLSCRTTWGSHPPEITQIDGMSYIDGSTPDSFEQEGHGDMVQGYSYFSQEGTAFVYNDLAVQIPSERRTAQYQQDRERIAESIQHLEGATSVDTVRRITGRLTRELVADANHTKLTPPELARTRALIQEKIPDPADQPLVLPAENITNARVIDTIAKVFGIDVCSLSGEQVAPFANSLAEGNTIPPEASILHDVFRFVPDAWSQLWRTTTRAYYKKLQKMDELTPKEKKVAEEILGSGLKILSLQPSSQETAEFFLRFAEEISQSEDPNTAGQQLVKDAIEQSVIQAVFERDARERKVRRGEILIEGMRRKGETINDYPSVVGEFTDSPAALLYAKHTALLEPFLHSHKNSLGLARTVKAEVSF